jgi:flavin reductase (DIM6/NTAB) family NADH-FMN oxidoreductase RutF
MRAQAVNSGEEIEIKIYEMRNIMDKINIGSAGFLMPMPMVIVGTHVGEIPNFMAVGWVTRVNFKPPVIGVALGSHHYTVDGIIKSGEFSVCIPDVDLMEKTDYVGVVSGEKTDKSDVFESFYGELKKAPMIKECPVCMECKLVETIKLQTNTLFLGEIVGTYTEERFMTDGKPDIKKVNPFTLTMPDNNYWTVGEKIGKAWNIGLNLKKEK